MPPNKQPKAKIFCLGSQEQNNFLKFHDNWLADTIYNVSESGQNSIRSKAIFSVIMQKNLETWNLSSEWKNYVYQIVLTLLNSCLSVVNFIMFVYSSTASLLTLHKQKTVMVQKHQTFD